MRMGKIIVKNIKGMGWKARIGLIAICALLFSAIIYQGFQQARLAHAAAAGGVWTSLGTTAPGVASGTYTPAATYTAGTGSARLLLVAVAAEISAAGSMTTLSATYGGVALTQLASTRTSTTARSHMYVGYLTDSQIPAGANSVVVTYNTGSAATVASIDVNVATYTGIDQTTPVNASNAVNSATTTVTTNAAIAYLVNGVTFYAAQNGGTAATAALTGTPTLTTNTRTTQNAQQTTQLANSATHTAGGTYASGGISITWSGTTSNRSALVVGSLRPAAVTTLGTGAAGTTTNVAPGAANQKLNGFSFVNDSGTTGVTGVTVTTTGTAAIASMSIWNEAGTTQYFSTLNAPTSGDTWSFSGGTNATIPVTTTSANYKVLVTYDSRALAPAGNTATTALISAYTTLNMKAGTDSADTTLTLLNTHAASTWGTCTAGDASVTLNWTKGTPTQSVIIIRYAANTDTTKPVDGTSYSVNAALGSGTVVYNGAGTTMNNTGLNNGSTYYYKIFEFDALNYYYNASDVWTAALTPVSLDSVKPVVDAGFAATTPINTLSIPITSYGATDAGGSGVSGYMITTSATAPLAGDAGWTTTPPVSYTVAAAGSYTLYPWAKDGANNVSLAYGSPVTVVVDTTRPTVSAFTVTTPSASKIIPLASFTASDTGGSNMAGYMVTTSSTPPAFDAAGWAPSAPTTFTVVTDGTYTLYPWAKDAAGNVSLVFGSPQTVQVDSTAPTGLSLSAPADEAVAQPQNVTLSCSTATDSGVGGVMYQFSITDEASYNQNSGWQAGTTWAPSGLVKGDRYLWTVKAKDSLGNETAFLTQRSFTVTAPCVRNNPTLILLTPTGGVATTVATDSGSSVYDLKVMNNDTGDCGSTTFNLSLTDTDLYDTFYDSRFDTGLMTKSVTLPVNSNITVPVTVQSMPGENSGVEKTIASVAADAYHEAITSGFVQTTLNVVTCQPVTPLIIVGPDRGYVNRAGIVNYTVTLKNKDTGAACTPTTYTFTKTDDNSTDFNASSFSVPSLTLAAGEIASVTLSVSAKSTAPLNAVNTTAINVTAPGHFQPQDITVKSTVNNPMLHNSDNVASAKWSVSNGWGIPNGRYGEISCETCHVGGGGDTRNAKRVNEKIFTPYTTGTSVRFPGNGVQISYVRYIGSTPTSPVLGWDSGASPRATSSKVCEVCHTYDAAGTNGVKAHPFATGATLGNHFDTDGKDCTKCHKHNKGFGAKNMTCTSCHGDNAVTDITPDNRYVIAPPISRDDAIGTLTGTGQVSNDHKVGAHQTHLRFFNGFSNYSTVDFRCQSCHGTLPSSTPTTDFTHANGTSVPAFQGLAVRGGMSPSFISGNLTCSNTYCHNPAASSVLKKATNTGSNVFPSWTSAKLLGDTRKTQANCGVCHKSPGDAGFEPAATHNNMTITTSCKGCHGHEGDDQGGLGQRHMDGKLYGSGACNTCHGYLASTWGLPETPVINAGGAGAHAAHITYLTTKLNTITLNPDADSYAGGGASWTNVCGVCHDNVGGKHMDNIVDVKFNNNYQYGTFTPVYNGTPGGAGNKSCSNLSCHYFTTPLWSN
jgi:predicted CxxxxCH...CXXCH cytochrome family protein